MATSKQIGSAVLTVFYAIYYSYTYASFWPLIICALFFIFCFNESRISSWIYKKQKEQNDPLHDDSYNTEFLHTKLKLYDQFLSLPQVNTEILDTLNRTQLLNGVLHLNQHNDDKRFELIYNSLKKCDLDKCVGFRRHYRDRNKSSDNLYNGLDMYQTIKLQILDKMHCYYCHSYDTGYRFRENERIIFMHDPNRIKGKHESWDQYLTNKHVTQQSKLSQKKINALGKLSQKVFASRINKYCGLNECQQQIIEDRKDNNVKKRYQFGYLFDYDLKPTNFKRLMNQRNSIVNTWPIFKFTNLKKEVTQNKLAIITIAQYNIEYAKAQLHFNSFYKRQYYSCIKIKHLLALLLYCNYDELQYEFSKTYRINEGRNHSLFYHWGLFLKEAIKQHGTRMYDGKINTLYHGISEPLSINLFIPNMKGLAIGCPLSTTSCWAVAVNFTHHNEGLIVEFSDGGNFAGEASARYFSVEWLSDFANEKEYLFVQNDPSTDSLMINDIINPKSGIRYHQLIYALYMKSAEGLNVENYKGAKWREKFRNKKWNTVTRILKNEIWKYQLHGTEFIQDEYGKQLIDAYLESENRKGMWYKIKAYSTRLDLWCGCQNSCTVLILLLAFEYCLGYIFDGLLCGDEDLTIENITRIALDMYNATDFDTLRSTLSGEYIN